jgi:nucleoside-diphosphate-sugar epimerase
MPSEMIFLTGLTGYIGQRIVGALAGAGRPVRGLVLPGESLPPGLPDVQTVRGNILEPATFEGHGEGVAAVVHSAAAMLPNPPRTIRSVNVEGTRNVVEAARRWGVARFVYLSAVSAAYSVKNSYGESKAEAERLVASSGLQWVVLRPTMVYGEGGGLHFARLTDLVRRAPGFIPVFGPGTSRLQPVHVQDVARAVMLALDHPSAAGGLWGISGATVVTFDELVRKIAASLGVRRRLVHVPLPLAMAAARLAVRLSPSSFLTPEAVLGLNQDASLDHSPFSAVCGYAPRTLDDGLASEFGQTSGVPVLA